MFSCVKKIKKDNHKYILLSSCDVITIIPLPPQHRGEKLMYLVTTSAPKAKSRNRCFDHLYDKVDCGIFHFWPNKKGIQTEKNWSET